MDDKKYSQSAQSSIKTLYASFKILNENGGEMTKQALMEKMRSTLQFTEWEMQATKSGGIRWENIFEFASVDCTKSGFIIKNKGVWFLTDEGKKALKLGAEKLKDEVNKRYKKWLWNRNYAEDSEINEDYTGDIVESIEKRQEVHIEALEEQAIYGIKEFIGDKNAYEFQDIVAALLRAMGYYTPFISPKGRDGGVDIIAYIDPLGATAPRLKVQVKHTPNIAVSVDVVRGLTGLLNKDGDVGVIVTSGTFTTEAERTARESHRHIKLLNGNDFIELWQKFYAKMPDEDKNLIPLHSIYFLGRR
jgi:restriction system protein